MVWEVVSANLVLPVSVWLRDDFTAIHLTLLIAYLLSYCYIMQVIYHPAETIEEALQNARKSIAAGSVSVPSSTRSRPGRRREKSSIYTLMTYLAIQFIANTTFLLFAIFWASNQIGNNSVPFLNLLTRCLSCIGVYILASRGVTVSGYTLVNRVLFAATISYSSFYLVPFGLWILSLDWIIQSLSIADSLVGKREDQGRSGLIRYLDLSRYINGIMTVRHTLYIRQLLTSGAPANVTNLLVAYSAWVVCISIFRTVLRPLIRRYAIPQWKKFRNRNAEDNAAGGITGDSNIEDDDESDFAAPFVFDTGSLHSNDIKPQASIQSTPSISNPPATNNAVFFNPMTPNGLHTPTGEQVILLQPLQQPQAIQITQPPTTMSAGKTVIPDTQMPVKKQRSLEFTRNESSQPCDEFGNFNTT